MILPTNRIHFISTNYWHSSPRHDDDDCQRRYRCKRNGIQSRQRPTRLSIDRGVWSQVAKQLGSHPVLAVPGTCGRIVRLPARTLVCRLDAGLRALHAVDLDEAVQSAIAGLN